MISDRGRVIRHIIGDKLPGRLTTLFDIFFKNGKRTPDVRFLC